MSMRVEADPQGPGSGDSLPRGRPLIATVGRSARPSRAGIGRARPTSTFRSAPTSAVIATSLRWRVSTTWPTATSPHSNARSRPSLGEPQEVDTIFVGGGTPTRLDAGSVVPARRDHQALVHPDAGRRVDRRGQSRARSTPRRPTSWPQPASIGSAWAPSRSSPICCASWSAITAATEVETGARDRAAPLRPLVARSDLRRPRLDHRRLARRPRDRAGLRARPTSRATGWSSRRGPRSGTSGKAAGSSRSTRKSSDACTSRRSSGWRRPDSRCTRSPTSPGPATSRRHNLVYWANDAYFGFGVGAARYLRRRSLGQYARPERYLRRIEAGEPATGPSEELTAEARARETAILMLRRTRDRHRTRRLSASEPASISMPWPGDAIARFMDQRDSSRTTDSASA